MRKDEPLHQEYLMIARFMGYVYRPFEDRNQEFLGWFKDKPENKPYKRLTYQTKHPYYLCRRTEQLDFRYEWKRLMPVFETVSYMFNLSVRRVEDGIIINDRVDDILFEGDDMLELMYNVCVMYIKHHIKEEKTKLKKSKKKQ